jgi:hypothetical protein
MKTFKFLLLALLTLPLLTGCVYDLFVEGNYEYVEERRTIPEFDEFVSSGSFNVFFEYASKEAVIVKCESNLLPYIETAVFNNQLRIGVPNGVGIRSHGAIDVYVRGPFVDRITLAGSGTITTSTINERNLDVIISGSGSIHTSFKGRNLLADISGSGQMYIDADCTTADFRISGSGSIDVAGDASESKTLISGSGVLHAYDFWVDESVITVSGSGRCYQTVFKRLQVLISGSGDVYFKGNPRVYQTITGSGRLFPVGM